MRKGRKKASPVEQGELFNMACNIAADVSARFKQENSVQSTTPHTKYDGNNLCGLFQYRSFNETLSDSRELADPLPLWESFWYEGEICCLFGDTGTGKSILAVQVAKKIVFRF